MEEYYSEKADKAFTLEIAEYNTLSDTEKAIRRNDIVERTLILLYEIPIRYLFATEDQAIDIFLEAHDEIDTIIGNFRLCGLTFNNYLIQICRFKLLSDLRRQRDRKMQEDSFLAEEEHLYSISIEESLYEENKKPLHQGIERNKVKSMNLKQLFNYIVDNSDKSMIYENAHELAIRNYLSMKLNRRRFLIFLLYIPETETKEQIDAYSKALDLDYSVIAQFFILKNSELDDHYYSKEKALAVAGRHWNTIQKLKRALYNETEESQIEYITTKINKVRKCHIRKCQDANKALSGMTHLQISKLLDIPRSTISMSIAKIKEQLSMFADDIIAEY